MMRVRVAAERSQFMGEKSSGETRSIERSCGTVNCSTGWQRVCSQNNVRGKLRGCPGGFQLYHLAQSMITAAFTACGHAPPDPQPAWTGDHLFNNLPQNPASHRGFRL